MAEERTFEYFAVEPILDRRTHPASVPAGNYIRLRGIDGRFRGAFRRFPGFDSLIDLRAEGFEVETSSPSSDNSTLSSVYFFKYIKVQVAPEVDLDTGEVTSGARARVFSGFVVAHDYRDSSDSSAVRGVVRFVYYDQEAGGWRSRSLLIERKTAPSNNGGYHINTDGSFENGLYDTDGPIIDSNAEYDAAAMGPFIYLITNRGTTAGKPDVLRRATDSFPDGSIPRDYYRLSIRVVSTGPQATDLSWHTTELGPLNDPQETLIDPISFIATAGKFEDDASVRTGLRMFSDMKNVAGPLIFVESKDTLTSNALLRLKQGIDDYLANATSQRGFFNLDVLRYDDDRLGPRLQGYRSIQSTWFKNSSIDLGTLAGATLYRENNTRIHPRGGGLDLPDTDVNGASYGPGSGSSQFSFYNIPFGIVDDVPLVLQSRLDPFRDDTAYFPRHVKLLQPYQSTLLRAGSFPRAASPAVTVDRDEVLSWGSLRKYSPEESRVVDAVPLGSANDETILAVVAAGDYAFVVGDTSIYRIQRNGQYLNINEVQTLAGGVGRYAALGLGDSLYFVNPAGLFVVEGPTGEFRLVSSLDRIIQEDWKDDLASLRMAYDNRLGAYMLLNDDKDEMLLIWANTGVTTELIDVPFKFGTQGPNPPDNGFSRAFWITKEGHIFVVNASRTEGIAMTMCGGSLQDDTGDATYVWNGTHDGGSQYNVIAAEGLISPNARLFRVHFLTGDAAGSSREIEIVNELPDGRGQVIWADPLEGARRGDRFAIAPIVFEVIGWPVQESDGPDLFVRKNVDSMGHNVILLGGEVDPTENANLLMEYLIYRRGDITTPVLVPGVPVLAQMNEDPSKNHAAIAYAGPTIMPAWRQMASNVDFELLAGIVHGRITESSAESAPTSESQ